MNKKASSVPVCIAVVLAALAAVFSAPTMAQDLGGKLLWVLQTQGDAGEDAVGSMETLQKLGLP
jgi:hypothetical protein